MILYTHECFIKLLIECVKEWKNGDCATTKKFKWISGVEFVILNSWIKNCWKWINTVDQHLLFWIHGSTQKLATSSKIDLLLNILSRKKHSCINVSKLAFMYRTGTLPSSFFRSIHWIVFTSKIRLKIFLGSISFSHKHKIVHCFINCPACDTHMKLIRYIYILTDFFFQTTVCVFVFWFLFAGFFLRFYYCFIVMLDWRQNYDKINVIIIIEDNPKTD